MTVLNRYSGQFDYSSPDLTALGFDWKELAKVDAEIRRLGALHGETEGVIARLGSSREAAAQEDAAAYAKALRERKADPGNPKTEALEKNLADARRKLDALGLALEDLDAERRTTMDAKRKKWTSEVEAKMPEAAEALRDAVGAVRSARGRLHSLRGLARWLEEPAKAYESKAVARDSFTVIGTQTRQEPPVDIGGALGEILRECDTGADSGAEGSAA
jgi:chromosome segregation ATPase